MRTNFELKNASKPEFIEPKFPYLAILEGSKVALVNLYGVTFFYIRTNESTYSSYEFFKEKFIATNKVISAQPLSDVKITIELLK